MIMNDQIRIIINGKPRLAVKGIRLSELVSGDKPCGGHGKCGKCRITVKGNVSAPSEAELVQLTADELERGIRLSCMTCATGDCEITTADLGGGERIITDSATSEFSIAPDFSGYGIAVDVGTTTLAARLYSRNGSLLAEAANMNPQGKWGADVISRIEAALSGKEAELAGAVRHAIDSLICELADTARIDSKEITLAVVTGNSVMLSLLTKESTEPFSHAPFVIKRPFGETLKAGELDLDHLSPEASVYLPPCISAFVGADTVCAILATDLCADKTAMLADIGTNGEMALWHGGKLTVCSTAAGPAFEGVGISMGMHGAKGAIDKVSVSGGNLQANVIGGGKPIGICGSGLVDAAACMLELEIIDETGYLEDETVEIAPGVTLTQKDVRALQLAKSAIYAGLMTLMTRGHVTPTDVSALHIAGGFGTYLNRTSAARIGLLPALLAERSVAVGNAALAGASMILLNGGMQQRAEEIARAAETSELSTDPIFSEFFMSGMMFE